MACPGKPLNLSLCCHLQDKIQKYTKGDLPSPFIFVCLKINYFNLTIHIVSLCKISKFQSKNAEMQSMYCMYVYE